MIGTDIYIRAAGGVQEAARLLGVHRATVSRWQRSGLIPQRYARTVREIVERHILEVQRAAGHTTERDALAKAEGDRRDRPVEGV